MSELTKTDISVDIGSWEILQEEINSFFYNLPKNTQDAYKTDLKRFFKFLQLKRVSPLEVRQIHIEEFMKYISMKGGLNGKPSSDRTYNRKLASLKSFYGFLGEKRIISLDPTSFVNYRKMSLKVETNDITNEKVAELFSLIPEDNFKHSRDRALIGVLFYTGCRSSELRNLRIKDYGAIRNLKVLFFKTKGGESRKVPVHPELEKMLEHYFKICRATGFKLIDDDPLFFSEKIKEPLARSSINDIFEKWTRLLKLDYKVSPHSARATLIGALHDKGINLKDQADAVAHKDVKMTLAYNKRKQLLDQSPLLTNDLFFSQKQ